MKDKRISIKIKFDKGADTSIIDILKIQGFKNFDYLYHDTDFPTKGKYISHVACDMLTEVGDPDEILKNIYKEAKDIINNSELSWKEKYVLIFSDDISIRVFDLVDLKDYHDPDSSYEEDIMAFFTAFREHISKL